MSIHSGASPKLASHPAGPMSAHYALRWPVHAGLGPVGRVCTVGPLATLQPCQGMIPETRKELRRHSAGAVSEG
eukprot:1161121-Pelagomonas_calceolata.AAC.4